MHIYRQRFPARMLTTEIIICQLLFLQIMNIFPAKQVIGINWISALSSYNFSTSNFRRVISLRNVIQVVFQQERDKKSTYWKSTQFPTSAESDEDSSRHMISCKSHRHSMQGYRSSGGHRASVIVGCVITKLHLPVVFVSLANRVKNN